MFYGGSLQNIISNNISIQIPFWFNEGMAEYQALGLGCKYRYVHKGCRNIMNICLILINLDGYFAYRGGQSVFYYIASKYGKEKIGELVNKIKGIGKCGRCD